MEYKTVADYGEYSVTINRSVFIGYASPAETEEEALAFLEKIRRKHSDARHNVYAYVIDKNRKRYSDDAEPQGTAGLPTLNVIDANELQNTVVVVTRYFGGILLGTGGLVRAYTDAADGAIKAAGIAVMKESFLCSLECSYNQYNSINFIIMKYNGEMEKSDFSDVVSLGFYIEKEKVSQIKKEITEATGGTVELKISDNGVFRKSKIEK